MTSLNPSITLARWASNLPLFDMSFKLYEMSNRVAVEDLAYPVVSPHDLDLEII